MSRLSSLLRLLPAVDRLLAEPRLQSAFERHGHLVVREAVRRRLASLRQTILDGKLSADQARQQAADLVGKICVDLEESERDPYRRVINGTGVLIHTNLGRAPLSPAAARAAGRAARYALALEYDLEQGERGARARPVHAALEGLFPGYTGLVATNNASGLLLALNTLAVGQEVVISRGELVEIGGSFRVPDILEKSGARLREVGTTNRTRIDDYRGALTAGTGAILRVHPSNFSQVGFTEAAPAREMAALAREAEIPFIVDQGSGSLHELGPYGIPDEPTVASVLEEGADLVTFSGDKLLGGPQSGLVVGRPDLVARLEANPMARALRPDKLILAALLETLACHRRGRGFEEIPVLRRLAASLDILRQRAGFLLDRLRRAGADLDRVHLTSGTTLTGGGSSPGGRIQTILLAVDPAGESEAMLAARLRRSRPALLGRLGSGQILFDLRTIAPEEDELFGEALMVALGLPLPPPEESDRPPTR